MRTRQSDLIDTIRVINRLLEKNGYNVRLELEYRTAAVGGSNVWMIDENFSRKGWPVFAGKSASELHTLLNGYWQGLSLGLMEKE